MWLVDLPGFGGIASLGFDAKTSLIPTLLSRLSAIIDIERAKDKMGPLSSTCSDRIGSSTKQLNILCQCCQNTFGGQPPITVPSSPQQYLHNADGALGVLQAVAAGCHLCSLLWSLFEPQWEDFIRSADHDQVQTPYPTSLCFKSLRDFGAPRYELFYNWNLHGPANATIPETRLEIISVQGAR